MTPTTARIAARRIRQAEAEDATVVRLAERLAPAVRIEPELLRAARRTFLPQTTPAVEADLWFSPLVSVRGIDGIVLDPAVADALRRGLFRRDPGAYDDARAFVVRMHRTISPALQIEEALVDLATRRAGSEEIDSVLVPVVQALLRERRTGLVPWARRALSMLPVTLPRTEGVELLDVASARLAGTEPRGPVTRSDFDGADLGALLPPSSDRAWVGLRLDAREGTLLLGTDLPKHDGRIAVLDPPPHRLAVRPADDPDAPPRLVLVDPSAPPRRIDVPPGPLEIRTDDASRHRLDPPETATADADEFDHDVMLLADPGLDEWTKMIEDALSRAGLSFAAHRALDRTDRRTREMTETSRVVLICTSPHTPAHADPPPTWLPLLDVDEPEQRLFSLRVGVRSEDDEATPIHALGRLASRAVDSSNLDDVARWCARPRPFAGPRRVEPDVVLSEGGAAVTALAVDEESGATFVGRADGTVGSNAWSGTTFEPLPWRHDEPVRRMLFDAELGWTVSADARFLRATVKTRDWSDAPRLEVDLHRVERVGPSDRIADVAIGPSELYIVTRRGLVIPYHQQQTEAWLERRGTERPVDRCSAVAFARPDRFLSELRSLHLATPDGRIVRLDAALMPTESRRVGRARIDRLVSSPEGTLMYAASDDGMVHVVRTGTVDLIGSIAVGRGRLVDLVAVEDEATFLALEDAGTLSAWDAERGVMRGRVRLAAPASVIALPSGNRWIIVGETSGRVVGYRREEVLPDGASPA